MADTLTSLTSIKARLAIPSSDVSHDLTLTDVWNGVEAYLLRRTGLALNTVTGVVDTFTQLQMGTLFALSKRPLTSITSVAGRFTSDGQSTALTVDIVNAAQSRLRVRATAFPDFWPPAVAAQPWNLWREPIWPTVIVTYVAGPYAVPADLSDAATALAAYWWMRDAAAAASNITLGDDSANLLDLAVPPWITSRFAGYLPRKLRQTV